MKIAFLTPEFPHPLTGPSGGIGTSIMNLSQELLRQGVTVSVLVYGQDSDGIFTEEGITVYRIKNIRIKGFSWYLTRKKIERLINTLHREKKIDVVEAPDWTGITSFINPKCPLTVRLHGSDTYFCHLDHRPVKWFTRFHEKRALEKADGLLSVSRYTADVTNELFGLDRQFTVISNGIDPSKFTEEAFSTSPEQQNILYFGTLIRKKGMLELPHIFNEVHKKNKKAQLVLVGKDSADAISGNPSTWQMMKPLFSNSAMESVTYLGSVDYGEIKKHITRASICVFPTFAEALPVSWLEAMAMRKAVVASDIGWASEIIKDGINGFLVHPANHSKFADAIALLLENVSLRNSVGSAARDRILEKFDIALVARQNIEFYRKLNKKK